MSCRWIRGLRGVPADGAWVHRGHPEVGANRTGSGMTTLVPPKCEIDGKESKRLMWWDLLLFSCSVVSKSL